MKKSKLSSVIEFAMAVVILNLMFLVCSLPLVTMGAAFTALYSGLRALIKKEPYLRAFFLALRKGFARSTLAWVILLAISSLPVWHTCNMYAQALHSGQLAQATPMLVLSALFALVLLSITTVVLLFYSRFECTISQLLRYGTSLTLSNLGRALPVGLLTWAPVALFLLDGIHKTYYTLLLFTVWLFFYYAVVGIAAVWLMNRPFALFAGEVLGMDTNTNDQPNNKEDEYK